MSIFTIRRASWTREIEQAINDCDVLLGLLTVGSYESEVCRAEQMRALRLGKCVIPVRVQPHADVPLYLETRNWREYPAQIPELMADIDARDGATLKPEYRRTRVYITTPLQVAHYLHRPAAVSSLRETLIAEDGNRAVGQTGPIGKNTTLSSHCPVALDDVWAERSEPAPRSLSSFPVVRAGEDDVLPA